MSEVSELMNRDPLSLTKDDLTEIVKYFRKQRHLFKNNLGTTAAKKPALTEKQAAAAKLDLGDLSL